MARQRAAPAAATGTTAAIRGERPEDLGIVAPTFGTITLNPGTTGAGTITLTFSSGNPGINGQKVELQRDADGTWICVTNVDDKFIDKSCTKGSPTGA